MTPARRLAACTAALLLAGLALWACSRLVWVYAGYRSELRGAVTVPTTGAALRPELTAVAVLALAAVAALVATSGWPRRMLGVLVVVAGLWAGWLGVSGMVAPIQLPAGGAASASDVSAAAPEAGRTTAGPETGGPASALPADAVPAGPSTRTAAPLLAVAGGVLLVLGGAATVRWAAAMGGMGSRYAAPASARRRPDRDTEWWRALDAGDDPTAGPGDGPVPDRAGEGPTADPGPRG
ncbi:MAG TPA: Trp biosynthesis-associated membrane protein [Pseudonocardia sp.]|jgi:uncharacterized membrane protein (TIGR02234 family)